jgi:hypothetical protein
MAKSKETTYFGEENSKRIKNALFDDEDEIDNLKFSWQTDDAEKDKVSKNLKGDEDINMPRQCQKDSIEDSDNTLTPDAPKCIFCGGELEKENYCPKCDFKFEKDDLFKPLSPNSFIFSELKSDDDIIVITPILYWRKKNKLLEMPFKVPDNILLNCGLNPTPFEPSKFCKLSLAYDVPSEQYIKVIESVGFIWDESFNKFVNNL